MQGFNVMHQGGPTKDTHLRHIGGTVPWQPTLTLDAFNHRGFFTADISPRTAPQINVSCGNNACSLERRNLCPKEREHLRVFVPHVEEHFLCLYGPCGDQHPLQEKMWYAFQVPAILEGAGLPLIAVDRHIARARIIPHEPPFLARRETSAAKTAQTSVEQVLLHVLPIAVTAQFLERLIPPASDIGVERFIVGHMHMGIACRDDLLHLFQGCVVDKVMPDLKRRCRITTPHTRRTHDTHL